MLPRGMALMYPAPSVSHPPTLLSDILSSSPRLGLDTSGPGHFTATHESPFHTQAEYSSAQRASTAAPINPLKRSLSQKLLSVEKRQIFSENVFFKKLEKIFLTQNIYKKYLQYPSVIPFWNRETECHNMALIKT